MEKSGKKNLFSITLEQTSKVKSLPSGSLDIWDITFMKYLLCDILLEEYIIYIYMDIQLCWDIILWNSLLRYNSWIMEIPQNP